MTCEKWWALLKSSLIVMVVGFSASVLSYQSFTSSLTKHQYERSYSIDRKDKNNDASPSDQTLTFTPTTPLTSGSPAAVGNSVSLDQIEQQTHDFLSGNDATSHGLSHEVNLLIDAVSVIWLTEYLGENGVSNLSQGENVSLPELFGFSTASVFSVTDTVTVTNAQGGIMLLIQLSNGEANLTAVFSEGAKHDSLTFYQGLLMSFQDIAPLAPIASIHLYGSGTAQRSNNANGIRTRTDTFGQFLPPPATSEDSNTQGQKKQGDQERLWGDKTAVNPIQTKAINLLAPYLDKETEIIMRTPSFKFGG